MAMAADGSPVEDRGCSEQATSKSIQKIASASMVEITTLGERRNLETMAQGEWCANINRQKEAPYPEKTGYNPLAQVENNRYGATPPD